MQVYASFCTHKGYVRNNNEDNMFCNGLTLAPVMLAQGCAQQHYFADEIQLYGVCDGMGGEQAGEEASALAVTGMEQILPHLRNGSDVQQAIDAMTQSVNDAIINLPTAASSGTTMALLCLWPGKAQVAHLGDSRVYFYRHGFLYRMTEDHTEAQRLLRLGLTLSEGEKAGKNALTRYLGMKMQDLVLKPQYAPVQDLQNGDMYLLCSDGITNMINDDQIYDLMNSKKNPAQDIVEAALRAGGLDNATALLVRIVDAGTEQQQ